MMKTLNRILSNGSCPRMSTSKQVLLPLTAGLAGALLLTGLFFGIVSWAESPQHAVELFWEDRWIVFPIMVGFGVQAALYTVLKKRLFVPAGPSAHLMGAGGATSSVAMVACCAHHVSDVLPLLGLSAAAPFLADYRIAFMLFGLGTTALGIAVMVLILVRERRRYMTLTPAPEVP